MASLLFIIIYSVCTGERPSERSNALSLCKRLLSLSMFMPYDRHCNGLYAFENVQSVTQRCINNGLMLSIVRVSCHFFPQRFSPSVISRYLIFYLFLRAFFPSYENILTLTLTLHSLSSYSIIVRLFLHRSLCFCIVFLPLLLIPILCVRCQ